MRREFDIFEKFSDGSTIWLTCVSGEFDAKRKVQEFAEGSQNSFFAIDITAGEILVPNASPPKLAGADEKPN